MVASTTMTVADALLKEVYEPSLRDQLQSEVTTLKRIESTSEGVSHDVGGKYVVFPIRTRRNHGVGARLENEALPEPKSQKYAAPRINLAYLYGAMSLTGQTMELAEKDHQSFVSVLSEETKGLKETLVKDMNRQIYGTSLGTLATVTADAANTVTVDTVQYLELGMIIDIYDTTGATERADKREITAIAGLVVTYSGADASGVIVATDILVRFNSVSRETIGFKQIVSDTGILYNINPATEPVWKSVMNTNGGVNRALSEALMVKMVHDIRRQGGKTSVIFCSDGVQRAYFQLLSQLRQIVNTQKFEGGFSGLGFTTDYGEVPVVTDFDCQANRMYFMNEKELKFYRENDWSFMNKDGSMWQRIITSAGRFDAYEAVMFTYCQLGTHRRNSHGLLGDLLEA